VVRPPYPVAVRLCGIAADKWALIDAAYYQINLLREKPYRFLNMVYSWCIERVAPEKLDDWIAELHELLPWQDAQGEAGAEIESDSFMNMMSKGG
jgi:hypothetical protein